MPQAIQVPLGHLDRLALPVLVFRVVKDFQERRVAMDHSARLDSQDSTVHKAQPEPQVLPFPVALVMLAHLAFPVAQAATDAQEIRVFLVSQDSLERRADLAHLVHLVAPEALEDQVLLE